jgi:hypothetical protein
MTERRAYARLVQTISMVARQCYHIFGDKDGSSKKSKDPIEARDAPITRQT